MSDLAEPLIKLIEEADENDDASVIQFAKKCKALFDERYNPLTLEAYDAIRLGKQKEKAEGTIGADVTMPARLGLIIPYLHKDKEKSKALTEKFSRLFDRTEAFLDPELTSPMEHALTNNEVGIVGGIAMAFLAAKEMNFDFPDGTKEGDDAIFNFAEKLREIDMKMEYKILASAFSEPEITFEDVNALRKKHTELLSKINNEVVRQSKIRLVNKVDGYITELDEFMELIPKLAAESFSPLAQGLTKETTPGYFAMQQGHDREKAKKAFEDFLRTLSEIKKETAEVFNEMTAPRQGRLSNQDYFILLEKYHEQQVEKLIASSRKINEASEKLYDKLNSIQLVERERKASSLIFNKLIDLFAALHTVCAAIPKLPPFLKTDSQKEKEKRKEDTKQGTRHGSKKKG